LKVRIIILFLESENDDAQRLRVW